MLEKFEEVNALESEVVHVIIQDKTIYFLSEENYKLSHMLQTSEETENDKIEKKEKEKIENILQLQCSTIQRK